VLPPSVPPNKITAAMNFFMFAPIELPLKPLPTIEVGSNRCRYS
jgi:hypothetical protein